MARVANTNEQNHDFRSLDSDRLSPKARLIVFDRAAPRLGLRMGNLFIVKVFR